MKFSMISRVVHNEGLVVGIEIIRAWGGQHGHEWGARA